MLKNYDRLEQSVKQSQFFDAVGARLFERWIEFDAYKYVLLQDDNVQTFPLEDFKMLIKSTLEYFQELNSLKSLSMCSNNSISFSSCLRIMDIMNLYSANKVAITGEYDCYDNLDNYPLAKLQITLKASQLLAESLVFAVTLIPKEKLGDVVGVIYNGITIDYLVGVGNIDDIIKEVCVCPYSKW